MLFGREQGDGILKSFAAGFSRHVPDGRVYRVGGCKFAFVTDSPETRPVDSGQCLERRFYIASP